MSLKVKQDRVLTRHTIEMHMIDRSILGAPSCGVFVQISKLAVVFLAGALSFSAEAPASFRIDHYSLQFHLDPSIKFIKGSATIELVPNRMPVAPELVLDLIDALTVTRVSVGGKTLSFSHSHDVLAIQLAPLSTFKSATLSIDYEGTPVGDGFTFGQHSGVSIVESYGLPSTAKQWWPSIDAPSGKAKNGMDMEITVPGGFVAASNGNLVNQLKNPDGTITFHWSEQYPIYPDTVGLTVTNFETFDLSYKSDGAEFPIRFYVFPEDLDKARKQFPVLLSMLQSHIKHFGPYPFSREKYGIAEFTVDSFREHQTMPSLGAKLITGDNSRDFVLAHESAHQWFGNSISVKNWSHIWLNEGFASYAYALWREDVGGTLAYQDAMKGMIRDFPGSIFIRNTTDVNQLFSNTTFRKGAWVLHMLRHVLGDDTFFKSLKAYVARFSYSNADTEDFRAVCEEVSGQKLNWFFAQWIYGEGEPKYKLNWRMSESGSGSILIIHVDQIQEGQIFRMPLDVDVQTSQGTFHFQIDNRKKEEDFSIPVSGPITDVQLDPNGWVLHN